MEEGVYKVRMRWPSGRETESLACWTGTFWRFVRHSPNDIASQIEDKYILEVLSYRGKES